MVDNISVLATGSRSVDTSHELYEDLKSVVYGYANKGVAISLVIGVLEIVKSDIMAEQVNNG